MEPRATAPRRESRTLPTYKPTEPGLLYSSLLAGVAIGMLVVTGFALTLLVASMVWSGPHRSWFLGGLLFVYLACSFATVRVLIRRLRAWWASDALQLRLRHEGRNLGRWFKAAGHRRMSRVGDY